MSKAKQELRAGMYIFLLTEKIKPLSPDREPYQPLKSLSPTALVWDDVSDPEKPRPRNVRVLDGVDTIFVDEQLEMKSVDNKWAEANAWRPAFNFGKCILYAPQDEQKIRALMMRDEFKDKKVRRNQAAVIKYELANPEMLAKTNIEAEKIKKLALDRAWEGIDAGVDTFAEHAKYLGVVYEVNGVRRSDDEIKTDYLNKAKNDPVTFNKHYNSPMAKTTVAVKDAIAAGTIVIDTQTGQATWGDSKTAICPIDLTKTDPSVSVIEFATSEKGKKFLDKLLSAKK